MSRVFYFFQFVYFGDEFSVFYTKRFFLTARQKYYFLTSNIQEQDTCQRLTNTHTGF